MALVKAIKGGPEAVRRYLEEKTLEGERKRLVCFHHSMGRAPEEIAFLLQLPLDEVKKYIGADEA